MKVQFAILMENEPGALDRILAVFSRRRIPLDGLVMAPAGEERILQLTLRFQVEGEPSARRLMRHLEKGISVLQVGMSTDPPAVRRELALVRVRCPSARRPAVSRLASRFGAETVDAGKDQVVFVLASETKTVEAFTQDARKVFEVLEVARSGSVEIARDPPPPRKAS